MVIEPDFITVCNYLFYATKSQPDFILEQIMQFTFHEVALCYPKFLAILPVSDLSLKMLNSVLPC